MDEIFIAHIQSEQLHHKDCRNKFVMQKLLFTTALLGIGSIDLFGTENSPPLRFWYLLYLAPFVAVAYDLYVFAEDFKVKRIGTFLRDNIPGLRKEWEEWVREHRESLAFYLGSFLLSVFSLLASAVLLIFRSQSLSQSQEVTWPSAFDIIWFLGSFLVMAFTFCNARRNQLKLDGKKISLFCIKKA